jgi:uncharacterized protein (TIGR02246 family)
MYIFRNILSFCFLLLLSNQAIACKSDISTSSKNIDDCYPALSNAYASLDPKKMADVYAPDGIYISARKSRPVISGKENLHKLYDTYFTRVKKHNSSLDLKFRVTNRRVDTKTINDVGYYLVTVIPPKESKQPPKQHAGKFIMTFSQQDDGTWGIWSEANSVSEVKNYINSQKVDGLYYDAYNPLETYITKK